MTCEGTSEGMPEQWSDSLPAMANPAQTELEYQVEEQEDCAAPNEALEAEDFSTAIARPLGGGTLVDEELAFSEPPVAVVEPEGMSAMGEAAAARGYMWIPMLPPGPAYRGRLGLYIEETIEHQLEERGALPPGIVTSTGLDASLSDQLYRARLIEMRGIALGIPNLEGIANLARTLDADDSSVLRWWMAATNDRPVRLLINNQNTRLRVYPSPVFFDTLFEVAPGAVTPRPASVAMAESAATMDLSDIPPQVCEESAVLEHQTNVLGTEVAAVEDLARLSDPALGSQLEQQNYDEGEYYEDEGDVFAPVEQNDVDLSDLDRALGLAPPLPASRSTTSKARSKKPPVVSKDEAQLALDLERPSTRRFETLIATPAPPSEPVEAAWDAPSAPAPAVEEIRHEQLENDAAQCVEAAPVAAAAELVVEATDKVELHALDTLVAESEASVAPEAAAPSATAAAVEDELDADDFLRTLAEDSAKAPETLESDEEYEDESDEEYEDESDEEYEDESDEEYEDESDEEYEDESDEEYEDESDEEYEDESDEATLSAAPEESVMPPALQQEQDTLIDEAAEVREPTPLPTKKIAKNPFIRFAQPVSKPASTEEVEAASGDVSPVDEPAAAGLAPVSAASEEPQDEGAFAADAPQSPVPVARPALDPNDPFNQLAAREWKNWVHNLIAARGPKPLSVIERMFVTDYTRLREAVRRGVADESAIPVLDEWRDSFTSSYSEAFDALRVRGKRPTMVLDLPELASRLGRLQGAKRVQLLMVDGMRFDLGLMVQERMRKAADASLAERLLLWSALPSVTSYQLELLGKGPDGLKESCDTEETPALVARGRAALTPRRVRTGALELLKLDVVEDMLRQPGAPVLSRMDEIADQTAHAIVEHINKLPPRTMVIVFGDHGFTLDPDAAGTTAEVLQGGASPEEVLVPAFAWLTGAVH